MPPDSYNAFCISSFLDGNNLTYIEDLYDQYLCDPQLVEPTFRAYFNQLPPLNGQAKEISLTPVRARFLRLAQLSSMPTTAATTTPTDLIRQQQQYKVTALINAYRCLGHRLAHTDPLELAVLPHMPELELSYHGLTQADLTEEFITDTGNNSKRTPLAALIEAMQSTYCGTLGAEFMHINDVAARDWIQHSLEKNRGTITLSAAQQHHILARLTAAEGLERYIGTKFVGQKRFSIEGADSLIPMLDFLLAQAAAMGIIETLIGMSHRGRLNVLVNVVGKPPQELFAQFAGQHFRSGSGDVKYHEGYAARVRTANGVMKLTMAFNPSHLECVNPALEGSARAKQFRCDEDGEKIILPVAIHGDAAFASQGVVLETFNLAQVPGYKTGGTVHIIINNQVGFTTDPSEARSTLYCTDIAKAFELPVFHVNGDDPEACVAAVQLALDFRQQFQRDVIIELVCYRRFGHNEADEPAATQPLMYRVIKTLPSTRARYAQRLILAKVISSETASDLLTQYRDALDAGQKVVDTVESADGIVSNAWTPYFNQPAFATVDTSVPLTVLQTLAKQLTRLPNNFTLQPQVAKMMADRSKMANGDLPLDWGFAETLAYATLVAQGYAVRLSGQDSQRGTFAHRHAVLHDMQTGATYTPLAQVKPQQATFTALNSILSEFAVLAFEYGYASASPKDLVLWEAQFGDFANAAQVIIDQFLSSGEQKWGLLNGLVLLLPHGYEGQGSEHSSARLERFLQLCAQDNMLVCNPTTTLQVFHMLRRQVVGLTRKPLIVMTPKSLLRHKLVVSSLQELAAGSFQCVLPEIDALPDKTIRRVIFCTGKVYYDLLQRRRELKYKHIALVRIEQIYPLSNEAVRGQLQRYHQAKEIIWCQEEPKNQGAWSYIQPYLLELLTTSQTLNYIGRPASAASASGYINVHAEELKIFLAAALKSA